MNLPFVRPRYAWAVKLPCMRFVLYGTSSFSYWLSAPCRPSSKSAVGTNALKRCVPTARTVAYLEKIFPQIPQPYHALVPDHRKSTVPQAVTHVSIYPYREKPFVRIADGVYASCPELCFVQLALVLPLHELLKAGDALCGTFFVDPSSRNGLGSRTPLTSKRRIESFVRRNAGLRGSAAAKSALRFVADNAASPPEAFLWSVLSIPHRYGGYALPGLEMNRRVRPSKKARKIAKRETLVPDLCHSESRLAIEYDSNAEHLTSRQIAKDSSKRLALEADGYKVISVTTRQLCDRSEMRSVAHEAGSRMSRRIQIRAKSFGNAQRKLYATGWSLRAYHRREWLKGGGFRRRVEGVRPELRKRIGRLYLGRICLGLSGGCLGVFLSSATEAICWLRTAMACRFRAATICEAVLALRGGASFCAKCPTSRSHLD